MLGIRFSGYTRFLERPGSLQLSPLLRFQRERVFVGPQFDVVAPSIFARSILDLEPVPTTRRGS